jgi:hypothetical protein
MASASYAETDKVEGRLDPHCKTTLMLGEIEGAPKIVETHGVGFHFYPGSVPNDFTGCQNVWLGNGHKLATTHYKSGKVTWIKGQEPKEVKPFFCRYKNEKLVESESFNVRNCPKDLSQRK